MAAKFSPKAAKEELSLENHKLRAILLGDSGSGKTTSALTAPGRKLYVDMDLRSTSIDWGAEDTDILTVKDEDPKKPKAWQELVELHGWLLEESTRATYDTVILDGITAMSRLCMNFVRSLSEAGIRAGQKMAFGGAPEMYHYNALTNLFPFMVHRYLALPYHMVFCGHLDMHSNRKTEEVVWLPKVVGSIRTEISSWFDESYLCEKKPKGAKSKYLWYTNGLANKAFFKSSLNARGKYWRDPVEIDLEVDGSKGFQLLRELRFKVFERSSKRGGGE